MDNQAHDSRSERLRRLDDTAWDLLVVGGGITGAGVAREAARRRWRVALVEQRDFAWGTSSRSSKLVHGGLRYLKQGRIGLIRESLHERERLMREAPELIEPQTFVMAHARGSRPGKHAFALGLALYDALAARRTRGWLDRDQAQRLVPGWAPPAMTGAAVYADAKTDDARLVQRVLREAERDGALVLNYLPATAPTVDGGVVRGLRLRDAETGVELQARARAVVNAAGVWSDALRAAVGGAPMLRPLRGSHLIVPFWRLPVAVSVSLLHPRDGRPVFCYPWEGATLIGTTDLDHRDDLAREPTITGAEVDYLLEAVNSQFPGLRLNAADVMSCHAGVRPIVDDGSGRPSEAAREHVVLAESGLVTVSGGKLTTFRTMALQALAQAATVAGRSFVRDDAPVFAPASVLDPRLPAPVRWRLAARYGADAADAAATAQPGELETVGATPTLWLELRWALEHESVLHLDDLLLRRTRIGLTTPHGGLAQLDRIRALCRRTLGWSDERWSQELTRYRALVAAHYSWPAESGR